MQRYWMVFDQDSPCICQNDRTKELLIFNDEDIANGISDVLNNDYTHPRYLVIEIEIFRKVRQF